MDTLFDNFFVTLKDRDMHSDDIDQWNVRHSRNLNLHRRIGVLRMAHHNLDI